MSLFHRMSAWVHRTPNPTLPREIEDPVVCDDCCQHFQTLAQYHFHHCQADE